MMSSGFWCHAGVFVGAVVFSGGGLGNLFSRWENLPTPVNGKSEKHAIYLGLLYLQRLVMFGNAE